MQHYFLHKKVGANLVLCPSEKAWLNYKYVFYKKNYVVIKKNEEYFKIPKWKDVYDLALSRKEVVKLHI